MSVGFVVGAEMADEFVALVLSPCETVPTGMGDFPAGPILS